MLGGEQGAAAFRAKMSLFFLTFLAVDVFVGKHFRRAVFLAA